MPSLLLLLLLIGVVVEAWKPLVEPPTSPWYYSCHDEDLSCPELVRNGSCFGKALQPDGSVALNVKLGKVVIPITHGIRKGSHVYLTYDTLTEHFPVSQLENPPFDELYVVQKRRSTAFDALSSGKFRRGKYMIPLLSR